MRTSQQIEQEYQNCAIQLGDCSFKIYSQTKSNDNLLLKCSDLKKQMHALFEEHQKLKGATNEEKSDTPTPIA